MTTEPTMGRSPRRSIGRAPRSEEDRERIRSAEDEMDREAMRAFLGGDSRPLGRMMQRHQRGIFNFCLRMLSHRGAAEDATQEVFLKAVRSAQTWKPSAKVRTWMYAIARNHCIDEIRKASIRQTDSLDRPLSNESRSATLGSTLANPNDIGPDRGADASMVRERLVRALASLPEEQREVFIMREQSGLPFKDIAEVVGAPENTVKSRMRYALDGIKRALAQEGVTSDDAPR